MTIPVKDIAERGEAKSIMPEGLTETLTKQEFADLVKFLSELGKVGGAYAPNKARLIRRWQVIEPNGENLNRFRRTRVSAAAEPDNPFAWSPVYSTVSGHLPLAELPKFTVWNDTAAQSVVRFQLDVTTAGQAKLKLNSVAGLSLYLGTTPLEPKAETLLDLKTGTQTVTVLIDRSKRHRGPPHRTGRCAELPGAGGRGGREVSDWPMSLLAVHIFPMACSPGPGSRRGGSVLGAMLLVAMWRRPRAGRAANRRARRPRFSSGRASTSSWRSCRRACISS